MGFVRKKVQGSTQLAYVFTPNRTFTSAIYERNNETFAYISGKTIDRIKAGANVVSHLVGA